MSKEFKFLLNGKEFTHKKEWITGNELLALLGLTKKGNEVVQLFRFGRTEYVELNEKIDLAPSGKEKFVIAYKFNVDGKVFHHNKEFITGREVFEKVEKLPKEKTLVQLFRFGRTEFVELDEKVDLATKGIEKFQINEGKQVITLIVNSKPKEWDKKEISFKEVITLAFGAYVDNDKTCYTVTFTRGANQNPNGSLIKEKSVSVKNKMIFNVSATDKS